MNDALLRSRELGHSSELTRAIEHPGVVSDHTHAMGVAACVGVMVIAGFSIGPSAMVLGLIMYMFWRLALWCREPSEHDLWRELDEKYGLQLWEGRAALLQDHERYDRYRVQVGHQGAWTTLRFSQWIIEHNQWHEVRHILSRDMGLIVIDPSVQTVNKLDFILHREYRNAVEQQFEPPQIDKRRSIQHVVNLVREVRTPSYEIRFHEREFATTQAYIDWLEHIAFELETNARARVGQPLLLSR